MNQNLPKKIVIVEDSSDYAELLERVLVKSGYTISIYNNGESFVEKILPEKPNLILLDMMLPGTSGFSILEELKKNESTKNIAVFCLTNLPEEVGREKALALGAYCYLTKAHYNIYDIVKHIDFYFTEEEKNSLG